MIQLRPGQVEVADYRKGYLAVPAVPGAGKTTVLAYLAASLIAEGYTGKGKILIVTYMNSAVANFRARVGDFLEARGLPRNRGYDVRTLHSLAFSILKEKPEELLVNDEFNIIDPALRGRLIQQLVDNWLRENHRVFLKYFDYSPTGRGFDRALERWRETDFPGFIKTMISWFKLYDLDSEKARELRRYCERNSYLDWALAIYHDYDRYLREQGLLDFDDLVRQALNLLEKDQLLLERLQQKYTYIFEDEAQDSNELLTRILLLLAGEEGNLVRVGDSNQAIMGTFTSANPKIFRDYYNSKEVDKRSILYSSRSTVDIINLANYLVRWSREEHPQGECRDALEEQFIYPVDSKDPFPNPVTDKYTIAAKVYPTSEDEIRNVACLAARHIRDNPENTAAILVPANYIIEGLMEELEKLGVKYESPGYRHEEQLKTIQDFNLLLRFLAEPLLKDNFSRVFKGIFPEELLEGREDLDFIDRLLEEYNLEEVIYPFGGEFLFQESMKELVPRQLWDDFVRTMDRLCLWLDASIELPPDELVLFIAEQMQLKGEELAVAQNMALQIKSELDLHPYWKLPEIVAELPRLEASWKDFAGKIYDRKGYEPEPGVITLTTLHSSKGLEWDTVYIVYLTDDNFPSTVHDNFRSDYYYLKDEYSNPVAVAKACLKKLLYDREAGNEISIAGRTGDREIDDKEVLVKGKEMDPRTEANLEFIKERLRLLYVAITRARKNLLLTAHREFIYDNGGSRNVEPARPFIALAEFIRKEREAYGEKTG